MVVRFGVGSDGARLNGGSGGSIRGGGNGNVLRNGVCVLEVGLSHGKRAALEYLTTVHLVDGKGATEGAEGGIGRVGGRKSRGKGQEWQGEKDGRVSHDGGR